MFRNVVFHIKPILNVTVLEIFVLIWVEAGGNHRKILRISA